MASTSKSLLESKTFWLNLIATAIAVLQLLPALIEGGDFSVPALITLAVAVLNIVLRVWFTNKAIRH